MIIAKNPNFFNKLDTVLNNGLDDLETRITTLNQKYTSLKTKSNKKDKSYKSKFGTTKNQKLPLIKSQSEQKHSNDYYSQRIQQTEPTHTTLCLESKAFVNLYKSSIYQSNRITFNYLSQ